MGEAWCHWPNPFLGLIQLGHPVLHQPLYGTWEGGGENETIIAAATAIAAAEEEEEEEEASRRGERAAPPPPPRLSRRRRFLDHWQKGEIEGHGGLASFPG